MEKIGKLLRRVSLKSKRGQVKTLELLIVLLALAFLLTLGFVFYARYKEVELGRIDAEVKENRANSLLSKISSMPELKCSISFGSASEINCIDELKLLAFQNQKGKFDDQFQGLREVRIVRLYPAPENKIQCEFSAAYPKDCEYWQLFSEGSGKIKYETFVTLCIQQGSEFLCEIGKLIISV